MVLAEVPAELFMGPDEKAVRLRLEQHERMLVSLWEEGLTRCYRLAKAERLHELEDTKLRFLDGRLVHPFSEACGQVLAMEALLPDLQHGGFDSRLLRAVARRDAEAEHWSTRLEAA